MVRGMSVWGAVWGVAVLAVVGVSAAAAQQAGGQPQGAAGPPAQVDAAVQVTRTAQPTRGHAVPAVAVHPDDPRVMAVVEGDAISSACAVHVSTDAGLTWTRRPLPQPEGWPSCVYANLGPIADVAFAPDGTLYVAFSGYDPATYHSRMFLARSTTLGQTWKTTPVPRVGPDLASGQFGADALPSLAIDPADPSRVFVAWMTNNGTWNLNEQVLQGKEYYWDIVSRPYVAVSEDGGRTFSQPVDMAGDVEGWMSEPHLAVGDDGRLLAFFGENVRAPKGAPESAMAPPAHLYLATSTDGGATFTQQAIYTRPPKKGSDWLSAPSPAVDRTTGDVYVVWDNNAEGPPQVTFMRSADGGQTWSDPIKINDVDPAREWSYSEFFPTLDVAPNGRLDVAWYDWRNDPTLDPTAKEPQNRYQDVYFASSHDGGRTWTPDVRVTDRMIDRRISIAETHGLVGPIGLASTDRAAYVAWSDTRNGDKTDQAQDIYFTRVRHAPAEAVFGAGEYTGGELSRLLWAALGAGGGLLIGGSLLLALTARRASRPAGGEVPVTAGKDA